MLRIFRIRGNSLAPEYQPGDFVMTSRIPFLFTPPQPGDVVAFTHPSYGLLIKRVVKVNPMASTMLVQGSHPDSVDSREFGPVPQQRVLGKVIWHFRATK